MPDQPIVLCCPECGYTGFTENDVVECCPDITGFSLDENGERQVDYGGYTEILWDTQKPIEKAFECKRCHKSFELNELVVVDV